MKKPYLIQRLNAPHNNVLASAFSFGGGLVNGGISKEGMQLLKSIFSFDYMGSSEFEWGAVPTALQELVKSNLTTTEHLNVYIIAPKEIMDDVKDWITLAVKDKQEYTKEYVGLKQALAKEQYSRTLGWLKIENDKYCKEPFMFFVDKTMFESTCKLFDIKN